MGLFDAIFSVIKNKPEKAVPPEIKTPEATIAQVIKPRSFVSIPDRKPGMLGGKAFIASLGNINPDQRDEAIADEIIRGNIPDFMRNPFLVRTTALVDGKQVGASFLVAPDYLCIGSDDDFITVPMCFRNAHRICAAFDCQLPTRKLVNAIWSDPQSCHISPHPMTPGPQMQSTDYLLKEHDSIESEKKLKGLERGKFFAGHKKDVVISAGYASHPGMEAIYGWHQPNGQPIQPLSFAHNQNYSDYSHGARLISNDVVVDGKRIHFSDLLADQSICELASDEGPFRP
jgi:hypothetical protein